jgi:hypothetical protein
VAKYLAQRDQADSDEAGHAEPDAAHICRALGILTYNLKRVLNILAPETGMQKLRVTREFAVP